VVDAVLDETGQDAVAARDQGQARPADHPERGGERAQALRVGVLQTVQGDHQGWRQPRGAGDGR
jgi:hypothetical protein